MQHRPKASRNADAGNPERNPTSNSQDGAACRVWWRRLRERTARRGVTLIEAVLFISIALSLIVGGLAVYAQVQTAARIQAQVRTLSAILTETRVLYRNTYFLSGNPSYIDEVLVASGAVPPGIVKPGPWDPRAPNVLMTEWGSSLQLALGTFSLGTEPDILAIYINLMDIPVAACGRLAVVDSEGQGLFSHAFLRVIYSNPSDTGINYLVKDDAPNRPDEAAAGCESMAVGGVVSLSMRFRLSIQ